jgi:Fe-Mn family superoxide dismutase
MLLTARHISLNAHARRNVRAPCAGLAARERSTAAGVVAVSTTIREGQRTIMPFTLSPLPYPMAALEPAISARTMEFHYGKHHAGYVAKLNKLVEGTPYAAMSLERAIQKAAGDRQAAGIFNNAAQVWNHDFFWRSMTPDGGGGSPEGALGARIATDFGSLAEFGKRFVNQAVGLFGSGWVWLVTDGERLHIMSTANANLPMTVQRRALLACDVWEHAYYLDYQHDRERFVRVFLESLADWKFAADQLALAEQAAAAPRQRARRAR